MGVRSTGSHPTTTKADGHLLEYFRQNFGVGGGAAAVSPLQGLSATGGAISDYTDGSTIYRSHTFTSTGQFVVSALGSLGNTVDIFLMGGGGGGVLNLNVFFKKFIFFFLAFTKLNAKNLDIEATKISLDKVNQTTVFEDNVKIITDDGNKIFSDLARYDKKQNFIVLEKNIKVIDSKNNIIETDYAEYDESKKIFKTKGYTKITTSENYIIISESVNGAKINQAKNHR